MEDIQLEDFLAFYPPSFVPGIQTQISAKKEFSELASDPNERLKKARGSFFKHQKFIQRFLQHYDSLLLFHETGTGKSCAITAASELLKKLREEGGHIKGMYIIVNNSKLKARMEEEIICTCTDGVYDTRLAGDSKKKVHKNLRKWYTVIERGVFASKLSKMTNEQIIRDFSNIIFVVDEAHNLRFRAFKGDLDGEEEELGRRIRKGKLKQFKKTGLQKLAKDHSISGKGLVKELIQRLLDVEEFTNERLDEAINSEEYALKPGKRKRVALKSVKSGILSKEEQYVQYWRLFHIAKNIKTVLATATPMVNEPGEIKDLLNLLLPSRIPYDPDTFYAFKNEDITTTMLNPFFGIPSETNIDTLSDEELEELFRGKVSYVRRLDTGVDIEYQGIPISELRRYPHHSQDYDTETTLFMERMSPFQSDVYKIVSEETQNELRGKERHASNFVYPDGSYGESGLKKYLIKDSSGKYRVNLETEKGKAFLEQISLPIDDPLGIYMLGVKFATIIELASQIQGNIFVYSNWANASGAVPFGVCLEAQGYERFDISYSAFQAGVMAIPTYCRDEKTPKTIRSSFKKKLRYAYLSPDIGAPKFESMMELMNSYENRHGEYIKMFITTPVGGEGISLSNIIQIHLMDGAWKRSTNYQAESRGIRATSHTYLIQEEGEITVKVYNHASYTCEPETPAKLCEDGDSILLSIDVRLYERSEEKDRAIKRIERIAKRVSVDCQIHFLRNTRVGSPKIIGKDGTAECDYAECVYKCWDPPPTTTDYSTYDVYYIDEPIEAVTRVIQEYFKTHFSVSMEDVLVLIRDDAYPFLHINIPTQIKYVQYAVDQILSQRERFVNRYGQLSYLQKDGNILFLTLDYPLIDVEDTFEMDSDVVDYTSNLIGVMSTPLKDILKPKQLLKEERKIEDIEGLAIYSSEFEKLFYGFTSDALVRLLEDALLRKIIDDEDDLSIIILERLGQNLDPPSPLHPYVGTWYHIPEPVHLLEKIQLRLLRKAGIGKGAKMQGRRPKDNVRKPNKIKYHPSEKHDFHIRRGVEDYEWGGEEEVYFHTLYSVAPVNIKYSDVPTFNNVSKTIRLYKPSEGNWRDATPVEQVAYSLWGQKVLYEFKEPYEQNDVYGFILAGPNPEISIRAVFKDVGADGRKKKRGRICVSHDVPDLLDILAVLDLTPPSAADVTSIQKMSNKNIVAEIAARKKTLKTEGLNRSALQFRLGWLRYMGETTKEKQQRSAICSIISEELISRELVYQTY